MAYTSNIPTASQRLKDSQPLIQANFNEIATALGINHGPFNTVNVGKHLFLQMPIQTVAPATNTTEMGLYTKTGITTNPEMYVRRANNGTEIEFTGSLQATDGWTRLPSGILLKWGRVAVATVPQLVVFPVAATIPVFSAIYNLQLSTDTLNVNSRGVVTALAPSAVNFSFYTNALQGSVTDLRLFYFALGI